MISTGEPFDYSRDQVLAGYGVSVTLPNALVDGPRVVGALRSFDRVVVMESVTFSGSSAVLRGRAYAFRDLPAVRFQREAIHPDTVIAAAAGAPLGALPPSARQRAESIRANYAQVDALGGALEEAFAQQALLEIETARFKSYAQVDQAALEVSWSRLVGDAPQ